MHYHEPVLLKESVDGLNIHPEGIYVDATFGGGGHSREILSRLKSGQLIAFDQDIDSIEYAIDDDRFAMIKGNFRYIKNYLQFLKIQQIDGLLADLGVSSHHFDEQERGFSFRFEAPLDMRMNQKSQRSAKEVINQLSEEDLANIFFQYGELQQSVKLASMIVKAREQKKIETIGELVKVIEPLIPEKIRHKYLAKVFQALRIEVNKEIECLKALLIQSIDIIKKGGTMSIISYHSLEDRLVKNFIRSGNFQGEIEKDIYGNSNTPFKAINNKVIVPAENELQANSRARSAKLRLASKC